MRLRSNQRQTWSTFAKHLDRDWSISHIANLLHGCAVIDDSAVTDRHAWALTDTHSVRYRSELPDLRTSLEA